jgi:hypothetical protein
LDITNKPVRISLPFGVVPWYTKSFRTELSFKYTQRKESTKKTPEIVVVLKGKKNKDVKLSLSLIKHHATETCEEVET